MATEIKVCPRCQQPIKGPTAWFNQEIYHRDCYNAMILERQTEAFKVRFPDNDSRMIALLQWQQEIYHLAYKQEKHLNTIETIMIIFVVLIGLSVVVTACSALGL